MNKAAVYITLALLCILLVGIVAVLIARERKCRTKECTADRTKECTPVERICAAEVVVLLTCTVRIKPDINVMAQRAETDRTATYRKSIRAWICNTAFKIVVVENSGVDISASWLGLDDGIYASRYERIVFNGHTDADAAHLRTNIYKGAHELFAIQKALKESRFVATTPFIVKVTGRFFVPGLYDIFQAHSAAFPYNGLRQKNSAECQIVGCRPCFAAILFNPDAEPHVETTYESRLRDESWTDGKVLVLPKMRIPPTMTGGGGEVIDSL